jgi:hemolysin activation/secretion protein
MPLPSQSVFALLSSLVLPLEAAGSQVVLDRADPTISESALPLAVPPVSKPRPRIAPTVEEVPIAPAINVIPQAITVNGSSLPPQVFADVIAGYLGRELDASALQKLVGEISGIARHNGYPLATASLPAQDLRDGILRVTLDDGHIDAVRVLGAKSPRADHLLAQTLVTGRPVRQADLERAILLVGDLAGLRVKGSRLIRQDGFGILLVDVAQDRASAYAQIDNRGTKEIGPIRATALASLRSNFMSGDEATLLVSHTPTHPSEFIFVRGRYALPAFGVADTFSISGSYGRSNPGGSLRSLNVIGRSVDGGFAYARSLVRSRSTSLVASVEYRHVEIDQSLAGTKLRHDRLDTLTGTLDGVTKLAGGTLRGQLLMTWGLPLKGVTHEGEPLTSRADGDARFVTMAYSSEWTRPLNKRFSIAIASAGQVASRPLLATAEMGVGGPSFGRAYDYADRTGDYGLTGSAEFRWSIPTRAKLLDRFQAFVFGDGGIVHNLRGGIGGGTLASAGGGIRAGIGRSDLALEIAQPLNSVRFDTGHRDPRFSFRLSRAF